MQQPPTEFQAVYDQFYGKIHHYLGRLVGESEAEDVTQEVFVKIDRGLAGFQGQSKLSTWVYRIATNTALDRLRSTSYRHKRHQLSVNTAAGQPEVEIADRNTFTGCPKPAAEEQVIQQEMNSCIREFVNRLPPNYRTVLILSELNELKNQEIADILGVSLDTVKIRLHRARKRLKTELENGCILASEGGRGLFCERKP